MDLIFLSILAQRCFIILTIPGIPWPKENSVEQIEHTDGRTIDRVHDYFWLHYAFVDEPAFGDESGIKSFCDGTTKQCQLELQKFNASIDNVSPSLIMYEADTPEIEITLFGTVTLSVKLLADNVPVPELL